MFASVEFTKWCDEMEEEGKGDLVKLVKKECRAFCSVMVDSVKGRLQSIWNHIQALELIDPLGPELLRYTLTHPRSHPLTHPRSHPRTHAVTHASTQSLTHPRGHSRTHATRIRYATPPVWDALKDLCRRRGIDFNAVQHDITHTIRPSASDLDVHSREFIRSDLCGYLRDRHDGFVAVLRPSPTPEYDKMCYAVFSIPLTSSFIESLFSKMAYNQSKIRPNLADTTMTSILHVQDATLQSPQACLTEEVSLNVYSPRSFRDKMLMEKSIGTAVCEVFADEKRYHGEVTKVIFHDIHAQYMYHVRFSDGDEQDYWRHELEMVKCRCGEVDTGSDSDSSSQE